MKYAFKTAVISDEISQNVRIAVDLAKEFSLNAIEVRGAFGRSAHELTSEDTETINGLVKNADMVVCGVAPPLFKCELNEEEARAHLDILRKSAAVAHSLGTNLVRGFAFWRRGPMEEVKDQIVPWLVEAGRIAEGEGVIIALENEYSTCNCNVRRTLELVDAVDSPAIRPLFDPGNDVHDPEGEKAWPDSYSLARPTMIHMHLKDPKRDPQTGKVDTLALGDGDVHVAEMLQALANDGYDGYVSLETHYRREPLSHEVARVPKGEEFSAGGYTATRECLERLAAMLANGVNPVAH